MCGLVVFYKPSGACFDSRLLQSMTSTLVHRGPDDVGFCFVGPSTEKMWQRDESWQTNESGVAMGHRRLSIIDLSSAGRQPRVSPDKRYWMVYNGEIYNYLELRIELERLGYQFSSETDSEVLLVAFAHWGPGCFSRLNGMWAVVIWDRTSQVLYASRDRFGEKPLFYAAIDGEWVFASEVKALLKHPHISARPSERSVFNYIRSNRAPSGAETYFDGIMAIEPGTYMALSNARCVHERYWNLPEDRPLRAGDEKQLADEFTALFSDAVQLRLRADVRIGTMLSGGLDSTSVISTVAGLLASGGNVQRVIGSAVQAFNASFPGEDIDETERVEELCAAITVAAHKVFPMQEQDVHALLQAAAHHMEMPFFNSVPLVHTLLMRRARQEGVTVVLNGHGSDEILAGYPNYHCPIVAAEAIRQFRWVTGIRELIYTRRLHGFSWRTLLLEHVLPWRVSRMLLTDELGVPDTIFRPKILHQQAKDWSHIPPKRFAGPTELDRTLREHLLSRYLPPWLDMEDRISMSASVEARQPFLDHRVVDFAFSLADSLKVRRGRTKHLLRRAMEHRLPRSIVSETRKFRFSGPDRYWLKGPLRGFLLSVVGDKTSLVSEFIEPAAMQGVVAAFLEGDDGKTQLVWKVLSTEMWLRSYFR